MNAQEVGTTVEVYPLDPVVGQPLEEPESHRATIVKTEGDVVTEQPRYQGRLLIKYFLSVFTLHNLTFTLQ